MRKGEELKAPRYTSAAATRDYIIARDIIPNTSNSSFVVVIYIHSAKASAKPLIRVYSSSVTSVLNSVIVLSVLAP